MKTLDRAYSESTISLLEFSAIEFVSSEEFLLRAATFSWTYIYMYVHTFIMTFIKKSLYVASVHLTVLNRSTHHHLSIA